MAVHFNILHLTTTGLRTAVAVHFNILHLTTTGLRTAVAVHFNIFHSTTTGLRTALAAFLSRTFGKPGILQLLLIIIASLYYLPKFFGYEAHSVIRRTFNFQN